MSALEYIVGTVVILVSLAIIFVVLFQQGRRAGINGVISGGADTFLSKTKARTWDARLARMTKYFAIAFFVLAIVANIIALNQ
ncbi:MAG: preprotein translocase subunit SecG [Clostridia bacterium]|nr:preprotein translocase subunit SecG [Oscillospiraceae bacterium]MBO5358572.1 preprotein translocase subunit SecG [Clostridia bacterium]